MDRAKLRKICENYISIILTIAVLIYFGFANFSLLHSFALDKQDSDMQAYSLDSTDTDIKLLENADLSENTVSDSDAGQNEDKTDDSAEEPEQGSVSDSDAEQPGESVSGGDAKIRYTYRVTNAEEEHYGERITESLDVEHLGSLFTEMKKEEEKIAGVGELEDAPTVELCKSVVLTENLQNTENLSFIMDFHGQIVSFQQEACLDLGSGEITFDDTAASEENCPGGIMGDGTFLMKGAGNWTFLNGWYENTAGDLMGETGNVSIRNGYFVALSGQAAKKTEILHIEGGFFAYNDLLDLVAQGEVQLTDEMAFAKSTRVLWERELTGYELTEPDYVVTASIASTDEEGNQDTVIVKKYYKEFAGAWENATSISMQNHGSVSTISLYNQQIAGISLSQNYSLYASADGKTAAVMLDGLRFTRQTGYGGNLFTVGDGRLILKQCTIDGGLDEQYVSQASAVRIYGGSLVLEEGTAICNNLSIADEAGKDVGAGIYLSAGGSLYVDGNVSVADNQLYYQETESNEWKKTPRNVYLEDGASLEVAGSLNPVDCKIGISHDTDVIAGLTVFGRLQDNYYKEVMGNTQVGEEPDLSGILSVFSLDQYESYYADYVSLNNQLIWDRDTALLPEAGVIRAEFIILFIGLFGFIVRNIPKINRCRAAERYIMVLSVICFLTGSGLGIYHIRQEQKISETNMAAIQEIYSKQPAKPIESITLPQSSELHETDSFETEADPENLPSVPDDGREYYGVIEIENLDIRLPVLADYSDADMKTTPCVYHGEAEEDNLVIVGHNYESQFGKLNGIEEGTEIVLTLTDGTKYSYLVSEVEELEAEQVEEMLDPQWDMTVFTCSYSGNKRVAVRCKYLN